MDSVLSLKMSAGEGQAKPAAVAFLTAHLPSARSGQAGQRIAYDHLRDIARGRRVYLIAFANYEERADVDQSLYALCRRVDILPVTHGTRFAGVVRSLRLPVYVAWRANRRVITILQEITHEAGPVTLWAEYTQMAHYIELLRGATRRSVLVCHDVLSQFWERRAAALRWPARAVMRLEGRRLRRWEARAVKLADKVLVLSPKDRDLLAAYGVRHAVVAYPSAQFAPVNEADRSLLEEPVIVFFGAMNRRENHEAVVWFAERVFPRIRSVVRGARLLVLGAGPRPELVQLGQRTPGVTVTGYVEDPRPILAGSWMAVAPLLTGAGLKQKVIEYLAQGLAVVATPVGGEGIVAGRDQGLIVCDTAEAFAEESIVLLSDRERCRTLGTAARHWFTTRYRPSEFTGEEVTRLLNSLDGQAS